MSSPSSLCPALPAPKSLSLRVKIGSVLRRPPVHLPHCSPEIDTSRSVSLVMLPAWCLVSALTRVAASSYFVIILLLVFPVFGYGGKVSGAVSHCFPLNANPGSPAVHGIPGVVGVYEQAIRTVYGNFEIIFGLSVQFCGLFCSAFWLLKCAELAARISQPPPPLIPPLTRCVT